MRRLLIAMAVLSLSGCAHFMMNPPPVLVVFFPDHQVTLTGDGKKIVDDAASAAKVSGAQFVELTGPSTKIAPGYDPSLAEPRIAVVEAELVAEGVSKERVVRASETTDGINMKSDPTGAQRVEIRLVDRKP
ncbi:MAG TPA: hypothetical protein VGF56_03800 [Rhizomicrobium sp.]|jgi:hypothetical protein